MTALTRQIHLMLIWATFGPYHLARLAATIRCGAQRDCKVLGLELAEQLKRYPWQVRNGPINKITLFPNQAGEEVSVSAYVLRTWQILHQVHPDVLAIPGYDSSATLTALAWAKINSKIAIIMSDSKADDRPRPRWKECLKRLLVGGFDAALVAGQPHREYAISLGINPERVFLGYDVVNNDYFAQRAAAALAQEAQLRRELGFLKPYFLTVSRFIAKKNLVRLLSAYRLYRHLHPENTWDLILCGSGPLEAKLREDAADLPGVHFPGFKQADELSVFYGLAGVFIMPSSHFEQWGLVVNEAMAAGLPVLVSRACGCAADLVQEGMNGYTFAPYDVEDLARLMVKISSGEANLKAMGEASRRIIANWTPEVFAQNLFKAVDVCLANKRGLRYVS